ncbi:hypothetical protein JHN55_25280 [Streptomyces sp. MBT56]|uniref:hypothetical protein n=1 Tax=unclassified Streptomyces TaxID=2593676 RepID=UPI00190CB94C|nr:MULTISPECIES: hypothetical protein [unclassified Streptomyces]MBK3559778.1 hypothetical protein [Streptomyces sp. MBT56]MBK3601280.1 hypothetical protein [Streptomyces sp. MBT54]MBK3615273.1 hypothetical protein [Streptomyces sp. MBT98]
MSRTEALRAALGKLHDNAQHLQGFADTLKDHLSDTVTASNRALSYLDEDTAGYDEEFTDYADELAAMTFELNRLCSAVFNIKQACEGL